MDHKLSKSKKLERNRHIYRAVCNCLLYLMEVLAFACIWINFYNPYFRNPYVFKGNVFAAFVYLGILLVVNGFYGRQKLGYHKSFNIIFGLSISAVLSNFVSYFVVVLQAATWYLSPVPAIIYLSLMDIAIALAWALIFNRLFRKIFPPNKLLLITGIGVDETVSKFLTRTDRYHIEDVIVVNGSIEELRKYYQRIEDYDGVIVGDMTAELRNDVLKNCYSRGIRTYTLPKITDVILKSSETLEIFDSPLFLNRNSGIPLEMAVLKRFSDIVMSLIGLVIASPFMIVTAIAIKLDDGGPVFYRQRRCTINGREFDILKFRSMIVNAEQSGISVPATDRDPRITRVGRVIRATRIDELPQLINILKGDMSVVGPRPERIEHVREYSERIPEFKYRMSVKGGLTGYAQVYGKYNTSPYDKLKLDLLYIQNYSIVLDLEIILKTIQVIFTKESTEGFDEKKSEELTKASRDAAMHTRHTS